MSDERETKTEILKALVEARSVLRGPPSMLDRRWSPADIRKMFAELDARLDTIVEGYDRLLELKEIAMNCEVDRLREQIEVATWERDQLQAEAYEEGI